MKFVLVGVLAVGVSVLEVASAVFVLVLLKLILEPGQVPEIPIIGDPRRFFPGLGYEQLVLWFALIFGGFFVMRAVAFLVQQYALSRVAENTGMLLAHRLVDGYLSMPYEFHLRRNSAELMRNAYDSVEQVVSSVFRPVANLVAQTVLVVALLAVLVVASPLATLAVTVLLGLTVLGTFVVVQPRLKRLGHQRQRAAQSAIRHIQQGLGGLRDIKVLGRERPFSASFRRARAEMAFASMWRTTLAYVPRVSLEVVFLGFVLGVLVFAVSQDAVESVLSTLGLFAYAGMRVQPSLQKIAQGLNNLRFAEAAVDELADDVGLVESYLAERDRGDLDVAPLPFEREIRFDQVTFRYSGAEPSALRGISLTIRHGESVGIAGRTGGGKTTLLDLLCGLLPPSEGRIMVDGVDVAGSIRAWQRNIGVVHQTSFLTDDTLRRNVAFGVPDGQIDDSAVREALRTAELTEFVDGLPEDLDTVVGERGIRLSGGQRQRVTLARALYRRPRLLVLDEGTSALDNATEERVIANLGRLRHEITLVMVAHRLTSIMRCDRIVFLEGGRITGVGSYEELKRENTAFRAMAV